MKTTYFFGCFLGCAAALLMTAAASEYTDDMSGANDTDFITYQNLMVQTYRGTGIMDPTALGFANLSQPVGSVVYLASGVETVRAAIYTHNGTLVTQNPADGQYMLGVFSQNIAETIPGSPLQALYCPQTGGIYTEAGGLKQAATDMANYLFVPVITPPQGEKIGYGVNIYYAADGGPFTRAAMTGVSVKYDSANMICREEYAAVVPQSATRIKVEINDANKIPVVGGGSKEKMQRQMTALASVTLSGGRMSLGLPVQSSSGGADPEGAFYGGAADAEQYAAQKSIASDGTGGDGTGAKYLDGEKQDASSKTESSSKFSGTITSSSKERRSSSSGRSSSKSGEKSGADDGGSDSVPEESEARGESIIHEILRDQEDSRFNGAVTAYIIVITVAILLVAVLPRKK